VRLFKLFFLVLFFLLYGCATKQPNLPSITDTPTGKYLPGKIVWHDLITHTPEASKRFYGELFGWEFEDQGLDFGFGRTVNYSLIRHQGELIGGMIDANLFQRANPAELSQWVVVMSVADIDKAVDVVQDSGGKLLTAATDVADRGRLALVEDSQGASFALLQTRDGDPADREAPPGGFLWDEVWPADVKLASAFYTRLTGLQSDTLATAGGGEYHYLKSAEKPRFGLLQQPVKQLSPTWTSYIRVQQPAAVAERVAELGGRVLLPVQDRDAGGQAALIAGPSGAGIAIQSWQQAPSAAAK
jgi:hypothetical protein